MKTLGLRHVALRVANAQKSKAFYTEFFGMDLEWEPDPKNVYLTTAGQDNLAIHEEENWEGAHGPQALDHIGFMMRTQDEVDKLHKKAVEKGYEIAKAPKQHRDGAYSFYMKDPDGYIVQVICHPPIVKATSGL